MEHPDFPAATVSQGPQYPKCPYGVPDNVSCDCLRAQILGFEADGYDHQTAIGLTAVADATYREASNLITTTLGGWDEFNQLTDGGWDESIKPALLAWYSDHQPLVEYLIEKEEELAPYWHQAKYPEYRIPEKVMFTTLVTRFENGAYTQLLVPGQPLMFTEDQYPHVLEAAGVWAKTNWGPLRIGHVSFMVTEYDRNQS